VKKPIRILGYDQTNNIIHAVREVDGQQVAGVLSPVVDGAPIDRELLLLDREEDEWTVETVYDPKSDGPAKVNSLAFHRGWDAIWGPRREASQSN